MTPSQIFLAILALAVFGVVLKRSTGSAKPTHAFHRDLRKKRPVMPSGISRNSTMASASRAT